MSVLGSTLISPPKGAKPVGVAVTVGLMEGVSVGVLSGRTLVGVWLTDGLTVEVRVAVPVRVPVQVGVPVLVSVMVRVTVKVSDEDGEMLGVMVAVLPGGGGVAVTVMVGLASMVWVGVPVEVGVTVLVPVTVGELKASSGCAARGAKLR